MGATAAIGLASAPETAGIGAIIATIVEVGLAIWTIYDLVKWFFGKEEQKEEEETSPVDDEALQYFKQSINSNVVNHFHDNPVPQQVVIDNLNNAVNMYLAGTKR